MTNHAASTRAPSDGLETFLCATDEEMQWFRDAKFGLFIHWGPAALGGGDISWCRDGEERRGDHQFVAEPQIPAATYDNFYKDFNPTRYDAREWVQTAQDAGMKYLVLTAKHHDGFSLFDTRVSDHKITAPDCPFDRDIVRELADACHESGMKFGLYYSARDWFHPDYLTENHGRYLAFYHAQLLELLTLYGQVDVLWFDHVGGAHDNWQPELVMRAARLLQPGILVNNRLQLSVTDGQDATYLADYDTPEQQLGAYQTERAWESCLCLVGGVWSYKPDGEMMSLEECLHALLVCAGGDGNLLLNTGPLPDGRIEPRQAERLREIGDWLKQYGEAIYQTRGGPFPPGSWGASTRKDETIYLHVTDPEVSMLNFSAWPQRIISGEVLTGGAVQISQDENGVAIQLENVSRAAHDVIVKLRLDGAADSNDAAWRAVQVTKN